MTKLTKLLPPEAAPAQTILERAHDLVMTSAEREVWPETIETAEGTVTIAVEERRPLEVGECFVDEKGEFWAVRPAVEPVLRVTGDIDLLREAAGALINRGVRVAPSEDGFMVLPLPNIAKMLGMNLSKRKCLSIEIGMQNSGLGAALATVHFAMNPMAALPSAIGALWHNITGPVLATVFAKMREEGEEPSFFDRIEALAAKQKAGDAPEAVQG